MAAAGLKTPLLLRGAPFAAPRAAAVAAAATAAGAARGVASRRGAKGKRDDQGMYAEPQLYDDVFGYRDFDAEAAFLRAAYARHCAGAPLASVLELGCGPARHSALLAKGGARVWALDASDAMLEYARSVAGGMGVRVLGDGGESSSSNSSSSGASGSGSGSTSGEGEGEGALTLVRGDMADFSVPGVDGGRLDMAMCLLGTFAHMATNDAAVGCFRAAARHLRPGGLLLLELLHPGDLFDGSLLLGEEGGEMWEATQSGTGAKLLVEWGALGDDFDPATQVLARTVAVNALGADGEPVSPPLHESVVRQRAFTLQELDLLGRLAGLKLAGVYGDLDISVGLRHDEAFRLVACLVKQQEEGAGAAAA